MKKIFLLLLASTLFCSFGFSQEMTLEQKLVNYLVRSQLKPDLTRDQRSIGFWRNHVKAQGQDQTFIETDLFSALHTVTMLRESRKHFTILDYYQITSNFEKQLAAFIRDADADFKKAGIMNFWPKRWLKNGSRIHNFTTDPSIINVTGIPDLAGDFDDSALTYVWLKGENAHHSDAFILNLTKYWEKKSGAFVTWYESPENNIVDCIVNINVLHAVSRYQSSGAQLSEDLQTKSRLAEHYLESQIKNNKTGTCAVFYDRSSQFFIALARLCDESQNSSLCNTGKEVVEKIAREALWSENATEVAEFIVALKLMTGPERSLSQSILVEVLLRHLKKMIVVEGNEAYLKGDSVFLGQSDIGAWANRKIDWISPAQGTATAFYALVSP